MRVRVSAQVPVAGLPGPEPVPVAESVLAPELARPSPGPARVPALAEVPLAGPALAREAVPLSLAPLQAAALPLPVPELEAPSALPAPV